VSLPIQKKRGKGRMTVTYCDSCGTAIDPRAECSRCDFFGNRYDLCMYCASMFSRLLKNKMLNHWLSLWGLTLAGTDSSESPDSTQAGKGGN
jgi:hypothetical protein